MTTKKRKPRGWFLNMKVRAHARLTDYHKTEGYDAEAASRMALEEINAMSKPAVERFYREHCTSNNA